MPIRSIGLDIGHNAVRAVALERTRTGWRFAGSASVPRRDSAGEPRPIGAVVGELDNLVGLGRAAVTIADSAHSVLVRFVATIPMPPERLAKLLRLELSQHADQGGDLAGDAFVVPIDGDEVIHACALGQPAELHAFLAEMGRAGISPRRIHVGAAALFNATLLAPPVTGDELALLVDIGESATRVTLVGDGRLLAFRQLATGGQAFTDALAQSRNIDPARAEQLKVHWAVAQATEPAAPVRSVPPPSGSGDPAGPLDSDPAAKPPARTADLGFDDMLEEGLEAPGAQTMELGGATLGPEMTRAAEALHVQLFNTLAWFRAQLQRDKLPLAKVLLSGGGAALAGLAPYLSRRLNVPVERFDPAAGLEDGRPDNAHELAGAIGLALSEHPQGVRLDLLPESLVRRRLWRERLAWPYVAAAALVVGTVVHLVGQWSNHVVQRKDADAAESLKAEVQKHYASFTTLKDERKALGEDLNAIVSRLTFNRDFLYVVRLLKEKAPEYKELWLTRIQASLQEEPARTETGTRLGSRKGESRAELRLPRGNLEIEGRFKFAKSSDSEHLNTDFTRYLASLEGATVPDDAGTARIALFEPKLTKVFEKGELDARLGLEKDGKAGKDQAVFPFGFMLRFSPITLDAAPVAKGPR